MPRSMGHPDYVYKPWPAERRLAASRAGKERWARKQQMSPTHSITAESYLLEVQSLFEREAEAWRALKIVLSEIDEAMGALLCANQYMQRQFPKSAGPLEDAYMRMAVHQDWESPAPPSTETQESRR